MIIIISKLYAESNFQGGLGLFFVCEEPVWLSRKGQDGPDEEVET